ncbi:hypothetical protein [Priestia megaterium]|uniref:hypothetical protein n=1 Tax=Priestia megaterium TaxID=1404 RepID=UPI00336B054A
MDSLFRYLPSKKFESILKEYRSLYISPNILKQQVNRYLERIEAEISHNEFINLPLAKRIVEVSLDLLNVYDQHSKEEQEFIHSAIHYFLNANDDEEDLYSPLGFDDDAEIINECLRLLNKENLTIDIR